jgi:phosphotransferase family enzyme
MGQAGSACIVRFTRLKPDGNQTTVHLTNTGKVDALRDPKLPWAALALDPRSVAPALALLPRLGAATQVRRARVTRHKLHRRCAIEYDLTTQTTSEAEVYTVIGRIRSRHDGVEDFARVEALWSGAFSEWSDDGISVPEPIGAVPTLHMWLQFKVPGKGIGELVGGSAVANLPERIAEAAHKIHTNSVPTPRRHTMVDEISMLDRYLGEVTRTEPRLSRRINAVLNRCRQLAGRIDAGAPTTIHGDFYHDQVIVHDRRVYVIDFDLYSLGDPALDVGNFVAHLTELALRTTGDPLFLAESEDRIVERFLELAGPARRRAIGAYTTLALARHIYLSVARPGRRATTEAILELCEERLDLGHRPSSIE